MYIMNLHLRKDHKIPVIATQVETDDGIDKPGLSKYVRTNSVPG